MPLPQTLTATYADEDALGVGVEALASAVGWTTYGPGSTNPTGSYWFVSPGEDGCSHIVGGVLFRAGGFRDVLGYTAADIDTSGIVNANVGGYVNADNTGISSPILSGTDGSDPSVWATRDAGTDILAYMAISLDAIMVFVQYQSSGVTAHGIIHIGKTDPSHGRLLQVQAKAKIASIATAGADRRIVLDGNINAALKDGSVFSSDPHVQNLFFQPINTHGGGAEDNDFAMTERFPIVGSSLTTSGGNTQFDITISGGVKLAGAAGRRYNDNRGVGDIVRLMSEPNVVICVGRRDGTYPVLSSNTQFMAWDKAGGQQERYQCAVSLFRSKAGDENPTTLENRLGTYRPHLMTAETMQTGLISQPDNEGRGDCGPLFNYIWVPDVGHPHGAKGKVNADAARRWAFMQAIPGQGLRSSGHQYAVGPGW